jgi:membrane fusion protein (multidrug efflux system)
MNAPRVHDDTEGLAGKGAAGRAPAAAAPAVRTRLQRMRMPLILAAPVVVLGLGAYLYLTTGRYQSTDDAYTQAATVSVSSNVAGRVREVDVRDNEIVKRGDVLFRLDDAPYRIAVSDAKARLASTQMQVASLKSTYRQRQIELQAALDTLKFAEQQKDRQSRLLSSGIASQTQFDQAAHAFDAARQEVAGAQQQIVGALANLDGRPDIAPELHPLVQEAQAALDRAELELSYTVITAPADGVTAKVEQLQVGDYIAASTPVFALVSIHDIWIEANFKEVQLAHMHPGNTATVSIDRYPDKHFAGVVMSVSPSTGSQFSMLPPENATGNWVKVVQRVPVRLQLTDLDPTFLLQAGLSANVSVDTQSRDHELAPATERSAANTESR